MITDYKVTGMTCEHCVLRVTDEVSKLSGVDGVTVDLPTGVVTVTSQSTLPLDEVRNALDEAGYDLAAN